MVRVEGLEPPPTLCVGTLYYSAWPPCANPMRQGVGAINLVVRVEGLEPPRLAAPEPKSGASANFAIPAALELAIDKWYEKRIKKNKIMLFFNCLKT